MSNTATVTSRRSFVQGAATIGLAATVSGTTLAQADETEETASEGAEAQTPAWLGEEPETPTEFVEELECDVVVCGLGIAGTAALRAAAEAGASVVAFDKADASRCSNEICAFGSPTYAEHYPDVAAMWEGSIPLLLNAVSEGCLYRNDIRILRHYLDVNGEIVDWYFGAAGDACEYGTSENPTISEDAEYGLYETVYPIPANYDPHNENMPCMPGTYRMGGAQGSAGFLKLNQQVATDLGATIYTYTPAVKLLTDETGRVNGVVARNADGGYIKATASQGVILCTGDYLSNEAMAREFLPDVVRQGHSFDDMWYGQLDSEGNICNTGDGHRMAAWVGGKMQDFQAIMAHFSKGSNSSVFGTLPYLMLDENGQRFMNEDVQGQQFAERIRQLPNQRSIYLFDDAFEDQMPYMPYGHGKLPNTTREDVEARVEAGTAFKADTLEELLANFDIDIEAALASIERYNELARAGEDTDFGKTASRMFPLENPPYYGNYMTVGDDLVTVGGIVSDTYAHAYNEQLQVIPGLYVAGNTQGCRWATIYPEIFMGYSVGMALVYGHEAGANAAQGI